MPGAKSIGGGVGAVPPRKKHTWTFAAASGEGFAVALGVCAACGLVRAQRVRSGGEANLDLTGDCRG